MASESPSGVFAKSADWHITDQIGGGGGAAMDAPMPTTVEDLQAEVMRLRQELEKERTVAAMATPVRPRFRAFSEDSEDVPAPGENPLLVAQSSTLPDGSTVLISEAELAGMRKLFDLFDTNGDGHIEVANLVVRRRPQTVWRFGRKTHGCPAATSLRRICTSAWGSQCLRRRPKSSWLTSLPVR